MNITCGKTQVLTSIPPLCALAHRKHSLQQITISSSSLHATNFHEVKLPAVWNLQAGANPPSTIGVRIFCNRQLQWYLGWTQRGLKRNCPSGPPSPWVRDQGLSGIVGLGCKESQPRTCQELHGTTTPPSFKVRLVQCCDCGLSLNEISQEKSLAAFTAILRSSHLLLSQRARCHVLPILKYTGISRTQQPDSEPSSFGKPPSQPFKIGFLLLAKCSDYSLSIFSMVKIFHICSLHMFFCKWLHHILPLDSPFMSVGISTRITLPYFLKRSSRRSHASGKWKWFK